MIEIKKFKEIPWQNNHYDCIWYSIYTVGIQEIFVPKEDNMANHRETLTAAYRYASAMTKLKKYPGYKIVIEIGEAAGQEISWPHIRVIPCQNKEDEVIIEEEETINEICEHKNL